MKLKQPFGAVFYLEGMTLNAIATLTWNRITYCKKGYYVQVLEKESKYTVFQNEEEINSKVSNDLVPLYFSEVIECE